jgi:hypothetical protein
MKTKFLYHAEAVAASGKFTLPVQESIEIQASVALPPGGGHGTARSENFRHRNLVSFHHAESHVVGSHSRPDPKESDERPHHASLSSVVIEGLNVMNVVTCDRLVMRLTTRHDDKGGEPSFMVHGSHFDNLRIAGHEIDFKFATDLFNACGTWKALNDTYAAKGADQKRLKALTLLEAEDDQFPQSKGMVGFTLAEWPKELPGGLTRDGHGIKVEHFGTVYLGELFISPYARRLSMLNICLGCSVEGTLEFGDGAGNGTFWP